MINLEVLELVEEEPTIIYEGRISSVKVIIGEKKLNNNFSIKFHNKVGISQLGSQKETIS